MKIDFFKAGLLLAIAAPALLAEPAAFDWSVKPALLNSDNLSDLTAGARFKFSADRAGVGEANWSVGALLEGLVAAKAAANNEGIDAQLKGGAFRSFGREEKLDLGPVNKNATLTPEKPPFSYLLSAQLAVGCETDQRFDNSQISVGPELGFAHDNEGIAALVPSVYVSYERINLLAAKNLEQLGIPENDYWRLQVSASWHTMPFAQNISAPAWLKPIGLHGDLRYCRSYDIPKEGEALSQKENIYVAADLSYELSQTSVPHLNQVYVRVSHGRLPPATREDTTVYVGFVFSKNKSP
jgi:hypothetical protein